jgi:hypothetical protein
VFYFVYLPSVPNVAKKLLFLVMAAISQMEDGAV